MYSKNSDILKKGYGKVAKAVMTDSRLTLTSKAIYAYLCSYLGCNKKVFPSRGRILFDLNLSKNAYYSHFKPLLELGYITISKRKHWLNRNEYVINCTPAIPGIEYSKTINSDVYSFGYGIVPKAVMTDSNLSVKAKGLLAYFYAFAGSGKGVFPTKKTILAQLKISDTAYYNALHQLTEHNYLAIQQSKDGGKFSKNEYTIVNFTHTQKCDTKVTKKGKSHTQKCDSQKCDNKNNNRTKNKNNISLNNYHISSSKSKEKCREKKLINRIKFLCGYDEIIESEAADNEYKANCHIAVKALISMATRPFTYRGEKVSTTEIHRLIKLSTRDDFIGNSLRDLLFHISCKLTRAKEIYKIHNIIDYTKTMIYSEMLVQNF